MNVRRLYPPSRGGPAAGEVAIKDCRFPVVDAVGLGSKRLDPKTVVSSPCQLLDIPGTTNPAFVKGVPPVGLEPVELLNSDETYAVRSRITPPPAAASVP